MKILGIDTLHIDLDGTLIDYDFTKKINFLLPYAREVTHLLSEHYRLVILTTATITTFSKDPAVELKDRLEDVEQFRSEWFPWIDHAELSFGNKAHHPGVKYLIDNSAPYFINGNHSGIYLDDDPDYSAYIKPGVIICKSWLEIALCLRLVEPELT